MCATHSSALDTASIGERLARAHLTGELADVDLAGLADLDAAEDVRDAALLRLGWMQVGYLLVGTHPAVARTLCLDFSVVAPLMRETILEGSSPLRLPHGLLGAGVGHAFLLGRSFPFSDEEPLTALNASQACLMSVMRRSGLPVVNQFVVVRQHVGRHAAHQLTHRGTAQRHFIG